MSDLHELVRGHLLDRELSEDRRRIAEGHLRLMEPLIAYCSGETELATVDELPTKAAVTAIARLLLIDPKVKPEAFALIELVGVPMSQMGTLPPNFEDYAALFSRLLILEFNRTPPEIVRDDWMDMYKGLFDPMAVALVEMFGEYTSLVEHFDIRVRSLMANNYMTMLALAMLYAQNGYVEGMVRIAPMLRVMPLIVPVGFPVGQGMKFYALCRG